MQCSFQICSSPLLGHMCLLSSSMGSNLALLSIETKQLQVGVRRVSEIMLVLFVCRSMFVVP